jgi:hypothetical protein
MFMVMMIIYELSQQQRGQLHRQRREIWKIQKYKEQRKSHIKDEIKITPYNNGINRVIPDKEKNCEMKRFSQ